MTRNERVTKLNKISQTHGHPNNQYYTDGLAVIEPNSGRRRWCFEFVDGENVTEISISAEGDIYKRGQYRLEKKPDTDGYYRLDYEYDYGPYPQYNDRIDAKIKYLLTKASR